MWKSSWPSTICLKDVSILIFLFIRFRMPLSISGMQSVLYIINGHNFVKMLFFSCIFLLQWVACWFPGLCPALESALPMQKAGQKGLRFTAPQEQRSTNDWGEVVERHPFLWDNSKRVLSTVSQSSPMDWVPVVCSAHLLYSTPSFGPSCSCPASLLSFWDQVPNGLYWILVSGSASGGLEIKTQSNTNDYFLQYSNTARTLE